MTRPETAQRAYSALINAGVHANDAQRLLSALSGAGISLGDETNDEFVVRWVNVQAQAVPPEADTIIRTITTTTGQHTSSTTHWLDGLRGPRQVSQNK